MKQKLIALNPLAATTGGAGTGAGGAGAGAGADPSASEVLQPGLKATRVNTEILKQRAK